MKRSGLAFVVLAVSALVWAEGRGGEAPPSSPAPVSGDTMSGLAASSPAAAEKEGKKWRIKAIRVEGCAQIPCRIVRTVLRQEPTPWWRRDLKEGAYDPFWAEDDRRRLELFYRARGFYSVVVAPPEVAEDRRGRGVTITYRIQEGSPVLVSYISIIFEDGMEDDDDLATMRGLCKYKEGDHFELEPYQAAAAAMENYYKDKGFYRARVLREAEVDPELCRAEITYRITHGPRYRLRSIAIEGCRLTDPAVVRRSLTLKEREWYSRKLVIENQRRLQRLPIFRSVRIIEQVDDERRRIDLIIRVEEAKPREVKLGLGYGSEEGVRVQVGWRHANFLGGARELYLTARWSELLEREEIRFVQPNLARPGNYVQLVSEHRVEHEPAYTHEAVAVAGTYHFIITRYLWADVSYRVEQHHTSRVLNLLEVKQEDLAREGVLSAVSVRLEWMDVDDPIRPTQGARAGLYVEFGGGPLGGEFSYLKVVGEARGYYPIFPPVIGALKLKLGWAEPMEDLAVLPFFLRFNAGGTGSVRGFGRYELGPLDPEGKPLGGVRLWEGSFELRFPISRRIGGVIFVDSGWVWPEGEDYNPDDVLYSAGFGLRYDTPIGPLALDFAFPLVEDPELPNFRFHFNVGHTF